MKTYLKTLAIRNRSNLDGGNRPEALKPSARSAGFQPAVSPISDRQPIFNTRRIWKNGRVAGWKPAKQQIGSLRYRVPADFKFPRFFALLAILTLAFNAFAAENIDTQLQKGLFEEEANHNLPAAIKAYEAVIAQTDEQRKLAATAVFRLGECYRKLGKTNEANAQYQRVVRDFVEQTHLVKLSRELLGLNVSGEAAASGAQPGFADGLRGIVRAATRNPEGDKISLLATTFRDNPDRINAKDNDSRTPLHNAVVARELQVVRFLLTNGANLELKDRTSSTALLLAAKQGSKEIIEELLRANADSNAADSGGATAAHYAAHEAGKAILQLLVEAGADVNARGNFVNSLGGVGGTPLHVAAGRGYRAVAELLVKSGADLNAQNAAGQTPLHITAIYGGQGPVAELLLSHGAAVDTRDHDGRTPLHEAASRHTPVVELLLKHKATVDARDKHELTSLFDAARVGHARNAELLIKGGANVNAATSSGQTPLLSALTENARPWDVLELLLKAGANVNARYTTRYSALHVVVSQPVLNPALKILLRYKPDSEVLDDEQLTPLHRAVMNDNADAVALLLEAGADPNARSREGMTPLHTAVGRNQPRIVQQLLNHEANPNIADAANRTPFTVAISRGKGNEFPELLIKYGADTNFLRRGGIAISRSATTLPAWWIKEAGVPDNRFTLFELLASYYDKQAAAKTGEPLPFPDLSRITISRLATNSAVEEITINVDALLREGDCKKDVWLNWGDVVNIPEKEHPAHERWVGFYDVIAEALTNCVQRQVHVVIKGQTNELTLRPRVILTRPEGSGKHISGANFWLSSVLYGSRLLLSTSDMSRVKVFRTDPLTAEKLEMTFDLTKAPQPGDRALWLRDGDVIEVPEKPATRASADPPSNAP